MVNKGRLSRWAAGVFLACCLPLLSGCGGRPPLKPEAAKPPSAGHVRVSRHLELLQELEPHLGLTSGSVKIEADEQVRHVELSLEVWEKGKVQPTRVGRRSTPPAAAPGVSVSVKE